MAKADIGKVIGKQGRTVQAIRTILSAASGKEKNVQPWRLLNNEIFPSPEPGTIYGWIPSQIPIEQS